MTAKKAPMRKAPKGLAKDHKTKVQDGLDGKRWISKQNKNDGRWVWRRHNVNVHVRVENALQKDLVGGRVEEKYDADIRQLLNSQWPVPKADRSKKVSRAGFKKSLTELPVCGLNRSFNCAAGYSTGQDLCKRSDTTGRCTKNITHMTKKRLDQVRRAKADPVFKKYRQVMASDRS